MFVYLYISYFMIFFRAVLARAMEFCGSFWWWAKKQKLRNRGWEWEVSLVSASLFQFFSSSLFDIFLTLFQVVGTAEEHPCPIANTLAWSNLRWWTTSSRCMPKMSPHCHISYFFPKSHSKVSLLLPHLYQLWFCPQEFSFIWTSYYEGDPGTTH